MLLVLLSAPLMSKELNQGNFNLKTPVFTKMKLKYEKCVLTNGKSFAQVSTPEESIKFAPIACKRELLLIKKFFLNSAFKSEFIQELIASIEEGVEIDLVKVVYNEKLFLQNSHRLKVVD